MPLHRRWCGSTLAVAAFLLAGASTAGAVIPAEEPATFPIARDRWPAVERAAQGCVEGRADVWGDVEVKVTFRPAGTPLVKLAPSARLPRAVVDCTRSAVVTFAREVVSELRGDVPPREWSMRERVESYSNVISLGKASPLLDEHPTFLQRWQRVVAARHREAPAARRLAADLPPDVHLTAELCLRVHSTPLLWQGIGLWLARQGSAVDPQWTGALDAEVWPEHADSKAIVGLSPRPFPHRYYLPDHEPGVVIYQSAVPPSRADWSPRIEPYFPDNVVCLLPQGAQEQQRIDAAIEHQGACWAGDTRRILQAPRFAFPADRRYATVAATDQGQACALDEAGHLVCCGMTRFRTAGTSVFRAVEVSRAGPCALDDQGAVSCWRFDGVGPARLTGVFRAFSTSDRGTCGVDAGGHLVCEGSVPAPPAGSFVSVDARAACALRTDGVATCWGGLAGVRPLPELGRGLVELATNGATGEPGRKLCGRQQTGIVRCWDGQPDPAPPADVPFARIVLGPGNECGIRARDGALECWRAVTPPPASLGPVRAASLTPSLACAITREGRAVCWGNPLWSRRD